MFACVSVGWITKNFANRFRLNQIMYLLFILSYTTFWCSNFTLRFPVIRGVWLAPPAPVYLYSVLVHLLTDYCRFNFLFFFFSCSFCCLFFFSLFLCVVFPVMRSYSYMLCRPAMAYGRSLRNEITMTQLWALFIYGACRCHCQRTYFRRLHRVVQF